MADDWIKMRSDLGTDPAVIRISIVTELDTFAVVGRLHTLWVWATAHTTNGTVPGVTSAWIDRLVCHQGFATALISAGWLTERSGAIQFPKFDRHMSCGSKVRAMKNRRQSKWRAKKVDALVDASVDARASTDASTREEKRREEKDITTAKPVVAVEVEKELKQNKAPSTAKRKTPDSPHHRSVAFFCESWESRYGGKYPFAAGKDGEGVKTMLESCGGEERFRSVVALYLADNDDFVAGKGHTVGMLRSVLAKYLAKLGTTGAVPDQCEQMLKTYRNMLSTGTITQQEFEERTRRLN